MKKIKLLFVLITMISIQTITAQVSINTDGTTPDASAILDLKSTEKGILIPRMNQSEIEDIASPAIGLMVFNTSDNRFYFYDDGASVWKEIAIGSGTITPTPTCGSPITYGGQSYNTVQIGTQCWMAKNLNIGTRIDGSGNQTNNSTIEKYCYGDNTSNCDTYGGLYQWDEMMQYVTTAGTQGICPTGWHLPTDAEWKTMEMHLGMSQDQADATGWRGTDEGGKLKETGTTHWASPNTGATNTSGFTGLPGGYRYTNGSFTDLTFYAYFWSSSENGSDAWYRGLSFGSAQVGRYDYDKAYGFSVRCVRD